MRSNHSVEMTAVVGILLMGGFLFVWMIALGDTIPDEFRNTSPGYGWSWDFDYEAAMREAGRSGAEPWPWPPKASGNRLVLPQNQTLHFGGLEMTYRGMLDSGAFRLDVIIQSLDASFTYQKNFGIMEAKRGFTIAERRFALDKITPRYIRFHSVFK